MKTLMLSPTAQGPDNILGRIKLFCFLFVVLRSSSSLAEYGQSSVDTGDWRWSHRCSDPAPVINEVSLPGPGRLLLGTIILHRLREKDVNFTFMIDLDRVTWWCDDMMMLFALWAAVVAAWSGDLSLFAPWQIRLQPVSLSICISRYLVLDIQISNKWNLNKSPCPLHYQPEFVGLSALPWLSFERSLSWISLYNFVVFEVVPVLLCHNKIFIYAIARSPHNIPPCPCCAPRPVSTTR